MTFIAAILVRLEFDEALSFEVFANIVVVYGLHEVFLPGLIGTTIKSKQLDHLISKHTGFIVSTVHRIADIFIAARRVSHGMMKRRNV